MRWAMIRHLVLSAAGAVVLMLAATGLVIVKELPRFDDLTPELDEARGRLPFVKTDRQLEGGIWVRERPANEHRALRLGPHDRRPQKVDKLLPSSAYDYGALQLVVRPEESAIFGTRDAGVAVYIVNATHDPISFEVQDGRLSVVQEAQNEEGEWVALERLRGAWCGNSFYDVELASFDGWRGVVRRYSGSFETRLRLTLLRDGQPPLLSSEWEGSVNPSQLVTPAEGEEPL